MLLRVNHRSTVSRCLNIRQFLNHRKGSGEVWHIGRFFLSAVQILAGFLYFLVSSVYIYIACVLFGDSSVQQLPVKPLFTTLVFFPCCLPYSCCRLTLSLFICTCLSFSLEFCVWVHLYGPLVLLRLKKTPWKATGAAEKSYRLASSKKDRLVISFDFFSCRRSILLSSATWNVPFCILYIAESFSSPVIWSFAMSPILWWTHGFGVCLANWLEFLQAKYHIRCQVPFVFCQFGQRYIFSDPIWLASNWSFPSSFQHVIEGCTLRMVYIPGSMESPAWCGIRRKGFRSEAKQNKKFPLPLEPQKLSRSG